MKIFTNMDQFNRYYFPESYEKAKLEEMTEIERWKYEFRKWWNKMKKEIGRPE